MLERSDENAIVAVESVPFRESVREGGLPTEQAIKYDSGELQVAQVMGLF